MTLKAKAADAFSPGKTPSFEESARESLANAQLRRNIGKATQTVPVSATAKFAPEMPTLAWRNFSRR